MDQEIKKILDRLERIDHKEYSCDFEFADSSTFDETARCFEERKKMANYITNLQQEIEKLNDDKRGMLVQLYKANDKKDKIKQENENQAKRNSRQRLANQKQQDLILNLQQENERLKEANKILEENWEHYMMICGKAIEELIYYKETSAPQEEKNIQNIINILQKGSEDNE